MNIIIVILARGGSKGIPRKNIALVNGKPLLAYAIEKSKAIKYTCDVLVSTDDNEIAAIAEEYGALVPFLRPKDLALDNTESLPVVQHAVSFMENQNCKKYDFVLYVQPTSPLCRVEDIESCIDALVNNPQYNSAVTTVKVGTHPFKMKRLVDGERLINLIDQGFEDMRPRQSLPPVYRRTGAVYASRRNVVMLQNTLVGDPCYAVLVPEETAIDIDSPIDLELVKLIMKKN